MPARLKLRLLLMLVTLALFALAGPSLSITARPAAPGTPLMFIENVGQFDERAAFLVRGSQGAIWLVEDGLWLTIIEDVRAPLVGVQDDGLQHGRHIKLTFTGANPRPRLEPFGPLDTVIPNFPAQRAGHENALVPVWAGVRYVDLYPGLDLELTGQNGRLIPRLVCTINCQSARRKIQLRVEGAAKEPLNGWIDDEGIHISTQSAALSRPHLLTPSPLQGPENLTFSTYIGDALWDEAVTAVVDAGGSAYITGHTQSMEFPRAPGPFSAQHGIDVYVVKVSADGSSLEYAIWVNAQTLFAEDYGKDIFVDETGSAYVVGETDSDDFCAFLGAPPGYDTIYDSGFDAFAFKLQPDGAALDYCTFFGTDDRDTARAVAVDESGRATIVGGTWSTGFPTTVGAYDTGHNGLRDVFALTLSADGTALAYSTFLGGSSQEEAAAVALDAAGNAILTGWTSSTNFPTSVTAFDRDYNGAFDAFVTKLNAAGNSLIYSTYLGGSEEDRGAGLFMTSGGAAYLAGHTLSDDFPTTAGAFDRTHGGGDCGFLPCADAFATVLNATGTGLQLSTYLGGNDDDFGYAVASDRAGGAYLVGTTFSANFPTTTGAFDTTLDGDRDAFISNLNATGSDLTYSTYLGGSNSDEGFGLDSGAGGNVYLSGRTFSDDFPTTDGAYSTERSGDYDIFVSKLDLAAEPTPTPTPLPEASVPVPPATLRSSATVISTSEPPEH